MSAQEQGYFAPGNRRVPALAGQPFFTGEVDRYIAAIRRAPPSAGYFAHSLNAYGRGGQPCPRCGSPIRRAAFMNRSSHFCPACQRRR
jgi:hypothetical protein